MRPNSAKACARRVVLFTDLEEIGISDLRQVAERILVEALLAKSSSGSSVSLVIVSPRLADIGGNRFWRIDSQVDFGELNAIAGNGSNNLIAAHWDDLLRLAGPE